MLRRLIKQSAPLLILGIVCLLISGCGLMMLPMLCDAPGSCGQPVVNEEAYGPCGWEGKNCHENINPLNNSVSP
jgi:hypothetical protein